MSTTAPDTRTSTYNPVSPTTTFPAGFPVFDIDDISVYVDGVKRTDFNVTATFVEGISNDARAVFSPGVTGEVIIVGDREPRRQSRFGNGAPLPIWAQNLALDTLTAQVQESYRDIARAVLVPIGDAPPTLGAKGRELLASSTSAAAINALGGAGGQIVDGMMASLDAAKLTGTIDPARIPVLPNNVQVMSSGGIVDLTDLQQAQVVQGAIVTTTDGRRWVYAGGGDKLDEASYIELADITPGWSAISGKPAFGSAALDESGDFATAAQGAKADTAIAALDTKFDKAGGTIAGSVAINGDLLTGDQVFLGATAGSTKLGGFRSGNNWVFAGNDGAGGYNWDAVLEWRAAEGSWNFGYRPTVQGVPLVNNVELATKFDKTGGTIAGSESAKISLDVATNPNTPTVRLENGNGRWDITEGISGNLVFLHYDTSGTFLGAPFYFGADGVPVFQTRPLLGVGGSGLATLAEVGSGSGVAGVSSFNGRTGTVAPQSGDYNSTQITHGAETVSAALARAEVKTPWLTPEMFGAVGDGSADDLAAFNAMIAAFGDRGGRIMLPPKKYYLSGNISLFEKTLLVEGVKSYGGANGSVLRFAANCGVVIDNCDGTTFKSFRIEEVGGSGGNALLIIGSGGRSTAGTGTANFDAENIEITGGFRNMWLQNSANANFRSCRFAGAYGREAINMCDGPDATHGIDGAHFSQCSISAQGSNTTDCIRMNGKAQSVKFAQTPILYGNVGIRMMNSTGGSNPKFFSMDGGGFENGQGYCVYIDEGDDLRFTGMYASNDGSLDGFYMGASMDGTLKIMNSTIRGCGRDGIRTLGGRLRAIGNDIVNNGSKTTGDGIRIGSGVSKFKINDNFIGAAQDGSNAQRYGVYNDAVAGAGTIQGNTFDGNTVAAMGGATTSGSGISNNL